MRLIGYCVRCFHIRPVRVTVVNYSGSWSIGICDACDNPETDDPDPE